jgi:L-arabinokinase
MPHAGFYVTGHGFGHASRVQAVVDALLEIPGWTVEIRTSAPRSIFEWLLSERCAFSTVEIDPGVIQQDAFHHDVRSTLRAWQELLGRAEAVIEGEASHLRRTGCSVVLSDVSPLACASARRAGVPCVVLGNFTWDWILEEYLPAEPELAGVIAAQRRLYAQADLYLRLPMSPETDLFREQRSIPLVARRGRTPPERIRRELGLAAGEKMILLSFGGLGVRHLDLSQVGAYPELRCVTDRGPGRPPELVSVAGLDLHYPDLIHAADLVLTKPGYSIIAEAIAGRTPLAYAPRTGFRENQVLEGYLAQSWPSLRIPVESLADGSWVHPVQAWLAEPRSLPRLPTDGAVQVAEALVGILEGSTPSGRRPCA